MKTVQRASGFVLPVHRVEVLVRTAIISESVTMIAAILILHAIFLSILSNPAGQLDTVLVMSAPS